MIPRGTLLALCALTAGDARLALYKHGRNSAPAPRAAPIHWPCDALRSRSRPASGTDLHNEPRRPALPPLGVSAHSGHGSPGSRRLPEQLPGVGNPQAANELSVYATEAYYTGLDSRLRRFTYRVDGFVSVRADAGGTLSIRPLRFTGDRLLFNGRTERGGSLRVGLEDGQGRPIKGFGLEGCAPIRTDSIAHPVAWRRGRSPAHLEGRPIRLRFEPRRADLFSIRFQ